MSRGEKRGGKGTYIVERVSKRRQGSKGSPGAGTISKGRGGGGGEEGLQQQGAAKHI